MQRIACPNCDLLIDLPIEIEADKILHCSRCKSVIVRGGNNTVERSLALTVASLIFLLFTLPFPFLGIDAVGLVNEVTIVDIFVILQRQGFSLLSLFTFITVIVLPLIYLSCLLFLLVPIYYNKRGFFPIELARMLTFASHWFMAEVFMLGVLVGLFKMISYAHVDFGTGFFTYIAFVWCLLKVVTIASKVRVWRWASDSAKVIAHYEEFPTKKIDELLEHRTAIKKRTR